METYNTPIPVNSSTESGRAHWVETGWIRSSWVKRPGQAGIPCQNGGYPKSRIQLQILWNFNTAQRKQVSQGHSICLGCECCYFKLTPGLVPNDSLPLSYLPINNFDAYLWLIGWFIDWFIELLIDWVTDLLIGLLSYWLIELLIRWLVYWVIDWLSYWFIDWFIVLLIDCVIDWFTDWFLDWN